MYMIASGNKFLAHAWWGYYWSDYEDDAALFETYDMALAAQNKNGGTIVGLN